MTTKLWTAANVLMLAMFILSTVVQFNDPDAPVWIAVYSAAAILTGLEIRRKSPVWATAALAAVGFTWSAYISQHVHNVPFSALFAHWEMKDVHIEEARETDGLLIVGVWIVAIAIAAWRRRRRAAAAVG